MATLPEPLREIDILANVSDAVFALDREWRCVYANPSAVAMSRIPAAELLGANLWNTFPELAGTEAEAALRRSMEHAAASRFEHYCAGHDLPIEVNAHPTSAGLALFVHQAARNSALTPGESHFRRIVEVASEGIWIVDMQTRTTFVNQRMSELLGYPPEAMLGRPFSDFIHPEDLEKGKAGFARRLDGDTRPREYRAIRRDGTTIWLDFTANPIQQADGIPAGVLAMCTDITERKNTQQQLQQTQKLESLGILAGGIAHDFNNLLVGILGNASLAVDILQDETSVRPLLEDLIDAAERAAQLTHQMLAYSGKGRFIIGPVDLSELIDGILPLISRPLTKSVTLIAELSRNLPPIEGDKGQLQQVIMNLVINAAEACGGGPGTVRVSTGLVTLGSNDVPPSFGLEHVQPGDFICFEVKDTGEGMPEDVKAKMFDPFFTTKFTGRGLGLAAVLGIVRSHSGMIQVESEVAVGTSIRVYFPVATGAAEAVSKQVVLDKTSPDSRTVLVVDDEEVVRKLAKSALERNGYNVLLAEDGAAAVRIFEQSAPTIAAVVLDLTMPVMDGEEALACLQGIDPDVAVVLSSGFNELEIAQRFAGKGLSGFLQKPYTAGNLIQAIRSVASRDSAPGAPRLSALW